MVSFFNRYLQILLPAMPQARQRDADDSLTMYIPKSVKKVVIRKDCTWHLEWSIMDYWN